MPKSPPFVFVEGTKAPEVPTIEERICRIRERVNGNQIVLNDLDANDVRALLIAYDDAATILQSRPLLIGRVDSEVGDWFVTATECVDDWKTTQLPDPGEEPA